MAGFAAVAQAQYRDFAGFAAVHRQKGSVVAHLTGKEAATCVVGGKYRPMWSKGCAAGCPWRR